MAKKYYVVKKGRQPGIYNSWPACQKQVSGYAGAVYRGFSTLSEAQAWLAVPSTSKRSTRRPEQLRLALGDQQPANQPEVYLYSDGGSRNHGNKLGQHVKQTDKAAWAYLIEGAGRRLTGTGGEWGSTNNRMELLGLINALNRLLELGWQDKKIAATLDSHYVLDPIMKGWLNGWRRRNWRTSTGKPVANQQLWQEILILLPRFSALHFTWTKGHANNSGNNTVDELLNKTMDKMGE